MKHQLPIDSCGPYAESMAEAIQTCVHCGFCLPTCPTYQELGHESDSPRGRILLMKGALEGEVEWESAKPHVDQCLGCVACETACPSGVKYGELISPFRAEMKRRGKLAFSERLKQWLLFQSLPYPRRFRVAMRTGRWAKRLGPLVPKMFRPMLALVPDRVPRAQKLETRYEAKGRRVAKVALLTGCAQQVLRPQINSATINLLTRLGVEVVVPPSQGCCGALAWHAGHAEFSQRLGRRNLAAFAQSDEFDFDAIVTNAAGCGSGLHDYRVIFHGTADEVAAQRVAELAVDVTVFIDRLGVELAGKLSHPTRVAYHDACHLAHAQRVTAPPRKLLRGIENLELVELAGAGTCCGSAGTYNIEQPELAAQLGEKKAQAIKSSQCDVMVTGNIGCLVQIQQHLNAANIELLHTVELLDRAVR